MRGHYRPAIQLGLRHFLRPFKRLGKKALKLHFQHKNDRTKIYFILMKLIWLNLLDDRDTIYNLKTLGKCQIMIILKKLFVAFPWVVTSTGPGGFMICEFII